MDKWIRLLIVCSALLLLAGLGGLVLGAAMLIPQTVLLFALAAMVAYAAEPAIATLMRMKPFPRSAAVAIAYATFLAGCGLMVWLMSGSLVSQVGGFRRDIPEYQRRVLDMADNIDRFLTAHHVSFSVVKAIEQPPDAFHVFASRLAQQIVPLLTHIAAATGALAMVILIALYLSLFAPHLRKQFDTIIPPDMQEYVSGWEADVSRVMGRFMRGQVLIAVGMTRAAAIGCWALGIRYALLIALFAGITSLVPVFGPYVGSIPPVIMALVTPSFISSSVLAALAIALYFFVINEIASNIVYPKLVGDALGLHSVVVLFLLFAGLESAGIIGALLAAPVAALCITTASHIYRYWQSIPDKATCVQKEG
jgi:predicted PurR-regulated permease PerM